MERCPQCRGRIKDTVCARCGVELDQVLDIEHQAEVLVQNCIHNLLMSRNDKALALAIQAAKLRNTLFNQAIVDFIKRQGDVSI